MNTLLPVLGIRFDIEKLEAYGQTGLYGKTAWKLLSQIIDLSILPSNSFLFEGDTSATLSGKEYVFCIVIQSPKSEDLARIREIVDCDQRYWQVAASLRFVDDNSIYSEPFPVSAKVEDGFLFTKKQTCLNYVEIANKAPEGCGEFVLTSAESKWTFTLGKVTSVGFCEKQNMRLTFARNDLKIMRLRVRLQIDENSFEDFQCHNVYLLIAWKADSYHEFIDMVTQYNSRIKCTSDLILANNMMLTDTFIQPWITWPLPFSSISDAAQIIMSNNEMKAFARFVPNQFALIKKLAESDNQILCEFRDEFKDCCQKLAAEQAGKWFKFACFLGIPCMLMLIYSSSQASQMPHAPKILGNNLLLNDLMWFSMILGGIVGSFLAILVLIGSFLLRISGTQRTRPE